MACLQNVKAALLSILVVFSPIALADTVLGAVAYVRTDERSALLRPLDQHAGLTALGAYQAHSLGIAFRNRYLPEDTRLGSAHALEGLVPNQVVFEQVYAQADDTSCSVATSHAFLQGLYPPHASSLVQLDPKYLANRSYLPGPKNGYQYIWTRSPTFANPKSLYTSGSVGCKRFEDYAEQFLHSRGMLVEVNRTQDLYQHVAASLAHDDQFPPDAYDYHNAFSVYEYFHFMETHQRKHQSDPVDESTQEPQLRYQIRHLAEQFIWSFLGNVRRHDEAKGNPIATIAGQTLAGAVLKLLSENLKSNGTTNKLNLLFSNLSPMVPFFALADLPNASPDFRGIPDFGSAMIFELFRPDQPKTDIGEDAEPHVRFVFRNGIESDFKTYPLFDSHADDMPVSDFGKAMGRIAIGDLEEWCDVCNSWKLMPFCALLKVKAAKADEYSSMPAPVAGTIGAVLTLGALLIVFGLAVGCFGLRMRRARKSRSKSKRRSLRNYKGGQKFASAVNLAGATRGRNANRIDNGDQDVGPDGEEQPGSWEMRGDMFQGRNRSNESVEDWTSLPRPVKAWERV